MTMTNAIRMTMKTTGRKHKSVDVVGGFSVRKRKLIKKWRNVYDSKTGKIGLYLQC
ncbi:hypothetical protein [Parageobacillus sp. G301]|uniref:hypothetical protein n=1 Tax=Parageobacillus sp. G301 TaxID=2998290 RepID=UPI002497A08D|nr:hypothetical protein [Parageobacillus sp. G301]GLH62386.1 hypothetical protein PG301_02260 [Parageobacillus sp. G301]